MIKPPDEGMIHTAYELARERYAALGVDTDQVLDRLSKVALSLHCWQGDDVGGFENSGMELSGGLAATGNYPGKARTADELRQDLDIAFRLIPGKHRVNLHAMYAETDGQRVDRNALQPEHFKRWVDWAKANEHGLDFNPSLFSHPLADGGFTLSSYDTGVRNFWIEHCVACREIGEYFGQELGTACVTNIWIPDGYKDTPADRMTHREILVEALDQVLAKKIDPRYNLDAVEPKLFGIGSESYVTGSHEFYVGFAITRGILMCLDSGHFHPTESIADKVSALLIYLDQLLLHLSRGVRWDSDHVVTYNDDLQAIALEIVRNQALERVHIGLDYFDASINRIAAWTIGARDALRAILFALLEPSDWLRQLEQEGDFSQRLALMEELKAMPANAVWDQYCMKQGVPVGISFMDAIRDYEQTELVKR